MAKNVFGGRPNKSALGRMKVLTVAVSVVAFLGSLGVIAGNGVAGTAANGENQASQVTLTGSTQNDPASAFARRNSGFSTTQQPGFSGPLTRSRGS